jgi:hypothetical protein
VLELPMEPFDFPDSDPGPHTLRAGVDEDSNLQRLTWTLSRFTGYAGVTNLLGQRFLSDSDVLSPAMTYLARRGLYFYRQWRRRAIGRAASGRRHATVLPSPTKSGRYPDRAGNRPHLSALEDEARAHGSASARAFSIRSRWTASPPGPRACRKGLCSGARSAIVSRPNNKGAGLLAPEFVARVPRCLLRTRATTWATLLRNRPRAASASRDKHVL